LLVFVIATSDIIHYFSTYSVIRDPWKAAKEVRYPCFLTSLTTVVGLGSLCLSDIPPVRYFGLFSAIGIALCYLLTFTFLPWVLEGLKLELNVKRKSSMSNFNSHLLQFVTTKSTYIIWGFIALTVLSIFNIHKLNVSDDLYDKFVTKHPLSQSNMAFQKSFNFLGPVELVVGGDHIDKLYFRTVEGEQLLKKLTHKLSLLPNVTKVDSSSNVFDYIRSYLPQSASESFNNPDSKVSNYLNIFEDYGLLKQYFSLRGDDTRITLFVSDSSSSAMTNLKSSVENLFKDQSLSQLHYKFAGFFPIRSELMGGIFDSFFKSFLFSYSLIFIIFIFMLRSLNWAILAMIPNTFPLFFAIALMNFFEVTIEYNLIVIFGIVLGVGVDDTIHFILDFKKRIDGGINFSEALSQCYKKTVNALMGTTLIFVITMPTFLLTDIKIFYQMAFLLCLILVLALLADILFLPAILKYFIQFNSKKIRFKSIFVKLARSVS